MAKETKAQRVERIKKEKDGLEVINDIYVYATTGAPVDPEDIDRLKWYGLYSQNKTLQDENDDTLYFMLRVKLVHGQLNIEQLETIESISTDFARGNAAITTRQDIQFHFITVRDLPEIFRRLELVGLSTMFAAGDVPRNAVTCPVNGIDHDQICDTRPIVEKVNKFLTGNKNFSNLPRKFKVGISGCNKHCTNHEIQDISFNAVKVSDVDHGIKLLLLDRIDALIDFDILLDYKIRFEYPDSLALAGLVAESYDLFCAYSKEIKFDKAQLDTVFEDLITKGKITNLLKRYN